LYLTVTFLVPLFSVVPTEPLLVSVLNIPKITHVSPFDSRLQGGSD